MLYKRQTFRMGSFAVVALMLAACSGNGGEAKGGRNAEKPAADAGYVELHSEAVPLRLELPGRTTAFETSEVRPQVSGIVQARLFKEGAVVKAGEVLYRIDPRLYDSALNQARADLNSALATSNAAKVRAQRIAELAKAEVVSRQDLLDAESAAEAAAAVGERARAAVSAAEINLQFTKVSAPISGRIGRSIVTTGALVSASQAEPLATIQRLDPIFVDIQQSSGDLLAFRRQLAGGDLARASAEVTLKLEDGSRYSHPGVLEFAESVVDPSTGTVTVRARFPNPEGWLLPGMYVRAEFSPVQAQSAILAPQQGISRDSKGNATALVIDANSKAELRTVVTERTVGDRWLVSKGLHDGDRLIVEGLGRIQAGQVVRPVAVTPPTS
ncbi:MAG: efflux RND transporter periplasmic adaptor subunit [Steroidobacteraceae bacterium]